MNILVSGSLAYDNIMDFPDYFKNHIIPDKVHNLNVSFSINNLRVNYGGTAGNIAYSLSLLGENPIIISTAGKDFEKYKKWLNENKIETGYIKIIKNEFMAIAHIITDQGDNQITAFHPGSMKYSGGKIPNKLLKETLAIVAPGYQNDMVDYPMAYKKKNVPYIFDPGQQITMLTQKDLRNSISGAKVFISNDYELSLVSKKTGWDEREILKRAEILITTLGEKGSVIKTKKEKWKISPAKPKNSKDPTGAGDAYRAGFIKGLVSGYPLEKCGKLASIIATYSVETYGTQTHKFSWKDVCKKYEMNFKSNI